MHVPIGTFHLSPASVNSVKLPKDARNVTELDQSGESYLRWQEDPYQDFMGLMTISGFTAANAPAFVDIADFNWTGDIAPNSNGNNSTDTDYLDLPPSNAAQGFSGIEGCYGPLMLQVEHYYHATCFTLIGSDNAKQNLTQLHECG